MLRRADSRWRDKSWRRQALMRKIPDSWQTGWKAKACTSFTLYLKVFKNHLYYLRHVRMLSIKPCLHTQLPEHNRSYWKVSREWGHLITWNGPIGAFEQLFGNGRGNLNKKFSKNSNAWGFARGMLKLRFHWYFIIWELTATRRLSMLRIFIPREILMVNLI